MIVDIDAEGSSHPLVGYGEVGVKIYGAHGEFELGLPLQFDHSPTEFQPYVFTGLCQDRRLGDNFAVDYSGGFVILTRSLVAEGYSISLAYDPLRVWWRESSNRLARGTMIPMGLVCCHP